MGRINEIMRLELLKLNTVKDTLYREILNEDSAVHNAYSVMCNSIYLFEPYKILMKITFLKV
jgi:hypothetical protein